MVEFKIILPETTMDFCVFVNKTVFAVVFPVFTTAARVLPLEGVIPTEVILVIRPLESTII